MRSKIFLGAVLLLCAIPTLAQTSCGTVSGMVTDISEGVIPGATIELTNRSTGVVRSTVTNDAGIYRFDAVDLGTYDLKIAMPGFKVFLSTLLRVEVGSHEEWLFILRGLFLGCVSRFLPTGSA